MICLENKALVMKNYIKLISPELLFLIFKKSENFDNRTDALKVNNLTS
jgi:hypothetical protein